MESKHPVMECMREFVKDEERHAAAFFFKDENVMKLDRLRHFGIPMVIDQPLSSGVVSGADGEPILVWRMEVKIHLMKVL